MRYVLLHPQQPAEYRSLYTGLMSALVCIPGTKVIKLFSCSTQLSMEFILLINVKMPTYVGILTFISRIYTVSESFIAR